MLQIPETHANRSPELDFVIAKHEAPKVRLPARLPSRPNGSILVVRGAPSEEEENDEEGTWDRTFVKTASINSLKSELKRAAKIGRADSRKVNMLSTA